MTKNFSSQGDLHLVDKNPPRNKRLGVPFSEKVLFPEQLTPPKDAAQ